MRYSLSFAAIASAVPTADAFVRWRIVPDIIPAPPQGPISAKFTSGSRVSLGNVLSPEKLQHAPSVEWNGEQDVLYTFMIVDPDAPSNSHP
ncbi:Protein F40A3.3 a, partial [Aphelenchoides avenae]